MAGLECCLQPVAESAKPNAFKPKPLIQLFIIMPLSSSQKLLAKPNRLRCVPLHQAPCSPSQSLTPSLLGSCRDQSICFDLGGRYPRTLEVPSRSQMWAESLFTHVPIERSLPCNNWVQFSWYIDISDALQWAALCSFSLSPTFLLGVSPFWTAEGRRSNPALAIHKVIDRNVWEFDEELVRCSLAHMLHFRALRCHCSVWFQQMSQWIGVLWSDKNLCVGLQEEKQG